MKFEKRLLLISTCGTSLFTNKAHGDDRAWLSEIANKKQLDSHEQQRLQDMVKTREAQICNANEGQQSEWSAELAGIAAVQKHWEINRVEHYLIHSDTAIGQASAEIVKKAIKQDHVQLLSSGGLRTSDSSSFREAMSDLTRQLTEMLPGYRNQEYLIIFNLTGGFKSVNAYLQAVGMLYADHCVFLFERANDLMEIPRLPVELRETDALRKSLVLFRKMAMDYPVQQQDVVEIPETLLMVIDGWASIGIWGEIFWLRDRKQLLGEQLLEPLSEKIQWSDSFQKSVQSLPLENRFHVNEALDEFSAYLDNKRPLLASRKFKKLEGNPCPPSTHELYLWSDGNASRAFGHYQQEGLFIFDSINKHL